MNPRYQRMWACPRDGRPPGLLRNERCHENILDRLNHHHLVPAREERPDGEQDGGPAGLQSECRRPTACWGPHSEWRQAVVAPPRALGGDAGAVAQGMED